MHVINNKVISLIIGSPGAGKSTLAAKIVRKGNRAGIPVYCNYPVLGARVIDPATMYEHDLGKSVLLIDEAGLLYNSRSSTQKGSKSFTSDIYHWYATTRHRETQVFIIVQSWKRVDTILRELGTEVIMCRKWPFRIVRCLRYQSETTLVEDRDGNALEFNELFSRIGSFFFWGPAYYHMFDTHHLDMDYLPAPVLEYDPDQFPDKLPFWRRLLGLGPARQKDGAAGAPDALETAEADEYDESA